MYRLFALFLLCTPAAAQVVNGPSGVPVGGGTFTGAVGFQNGTATAAGTSQGTATPITSQYTNFNNVAAGTGGILSGSINVPYYIVDTGSNSLLVYPPSGAAIAPYATNAPVSVAAGGGAVGIVCSSTTVCLVLP